MNTLTISDVCYLQQVVSQEIDAVSETGISCSCDTPDPDERIEELSFIYKKLEVLATKLLEG